MSELVNYLKMELQKGKTIKSISEKFGVSELEILGYVYKLKEDGVNIDYYEKEGESYLVRNEHPDLSHVNTYYFKENLDEHTKIAVIADIRAGSKCEQFRVLNDM